MKQALFFRSLAAIAMMLLFISIPGCSGLSGTNSFVGISGTTQQPGAAIFVSQQAPVMMSMLVNPDKLQVLEREGELSKLKTSLLASTGLDYKQDIQPWLGNEITLAVTTEDIDRDPSNGQQPGYLMALATKNPEKSREFVDLLFSKRAIAGANLTTEQYEGIKLIFDSPQVDPKSKMQNSLAGAVIGDDFVLFANDPKVLREAINNVQGPDLNITTSSQYQQAVKQIPKGALAVAFLNLPNIAQWQGLKLPEPATYDSEIVSVVLTNKGLLAETSLLAQGETAPPLEPLSQPVGALQYIPTSAGLAIAGKSLSSLPNSNLNQVWEQIKVAISGSEKNIVSGLIKPVVDLQTDSDINLKEDIFSWVQGEYAIGLLPRSGQANPDFVFVVEKTETTPAGISRLDEIAYSQGLSLNTFDIDKQKISAWTQLKATKVADPQQREKYTIEAKVSGVRISQGNYEILASNLETMNEIINAKNNSLISDRQFKNSIAAIPQPNQGYVYLDWAKSRELLENQFPILKLAEILAKPIFENLRSLTMSSYGSDTKIFKIGVFFQLGK
ncbi:hypothetical protein NIES592_00200 [Fischerella major NIES-592]|uniref:DUF3352 domain-containing protein n=2 Tax=Fischerella TaxID=1190 RepID=A0A1U7H4B2_9CYAN|nr:MULTISPECIES: DUF3352 domain-containing protein [Fischerella]OKH16140.1 hypothetical protein NIES592_00200 [Fischerella major NIES-592]PMB39739.1 DUF3352 domain-containing protein [Fischerella thermalis CCMEE 5330]